MPRARVFLFLTVAGLAGCGPPANNPDPGEPESRTAEAVFESLENALEDAEAVEDLSLRQKARRDAALSQMEEGKAREER